MKIFPVAVMNENFPTITKLLAKWISFKLNSAQVHWV